MPVEVVRAVSVYNKDAVPFRWAVTTATVIRTEAYPPMGLPHPWGVCLVGDATIHLRGTRI